MSYSTCVILNTRQDLLDYVSENSGQEVDVSTMFQIRDPLICEVGFLTQLKISLPCLTARRKRERESLESKLEIKFALKNTVNIAYKTFRKKVLCYLKSLFGDLSLNVFILKIPILQHKISSNFSSPKDGKE